jgi:hypothetical protein
MTRHFFWTIICMCWSVAVLAAPEQKAGAGPVCLYESKAYSDGAYICVQKSLMLVCASDGANAAWKPAIDKDINDRCTVPMTLYYPEEPRLHRRHAMVRKVHPVAETSAKCFTFNGRQYCE